jgi:hypothetical protein
LPSYLFAGRKVSTDHLLGPHSTVTTSGHDQNQVW